MIIKKNNNDISPLIDYVINPDRDFFSIKNCEKCLVVLRSIKKQEDPQGLLLVETIEAGLSNPAMVDNEYYRVLKKRILDYTFHKNYLVEGVLFAIVAIMIWITFTELWLANILFGALCIYFTSLINHHRRDTVLYKILKNKLCKITSHI